ncbi:RNA polymerase subunit sigma-70 [Morganella psychrotolerans]|uniref:RNA polymerase subunit sigma-70 n=1 Tax=Morganella psychrotolerans TaxID=368603 RepID=UPI0039AED9D4
MTTMNISDYANHAGVNRKTITRWMQSGKYIVKVGDDIDVEASDKNLKKYRDSQDLRTKNAAKKTEAPEKKPAKDKGNFQQRAESVYAGLVSGDEQVRDLEESRAIKEHYFAELARLEYEEKSGLVLPWQDMIDKIGEEYHAMRTRLIAIAPEHGPRLRSLALTSSDAEFVAAVQDIIHEAMEELSLDHSEQGG